MEGVIRTRVGYTGGQMPDPTYDNIGDHTEAIQIDYDPRKISFDQLLDAFWSSHNPTRRSWLRQYRSAIFYQGPHQEQEVQASKAKMEEKLDRKIRTHIAPLARFYLAEDYHQKYTLRRQWEFMRDLSGAYPKGRDLVSSTAAARLNGYLDGHGNLEQLEREIEQLGLSPQNRNRLLDKVRRRGR